uniref:Uncharacterized protein n=1 Tax=Avena sativa TaxID=4498 RepID=A0ACD5V5H2_AVESA
MTTAARARRRHPSSMAQAQSASSQATSDPPTEHRIVIPNKHGEKLVGLLHPMSSNKIVVLCHGFMASKKSSVIVDLADAITKQGISIFRFDFSGNGESEGEFQYGNYRKEADDLHSVVSYLYQEKYDVTAIVGHSKGGDVVVLYASLYDDVRTVVNLSGRFYLEKGIEERLGKEFIDRINKEGYIDVTGKSGKFLYRVTKDSLMERLSIDMRATSLSISNECRSETNLGIITLIFELPTVTSSTTWHQHDTFTFTKIVVPAH